MHIFFVDTINCLPPHQVTDKNKLTVLKTNLEKKGWDGPPLIGYFKLGDTKEKITLLSGSHRWAAANDLGVKVPVEVYSITQVEAKWGKPEWMHMMQPTANIRLIYEDKTKTLEVK